MGQYLYTAEDSEGKKVTQRVEAPNLDYAKMRLEREGYRAIVFHEDEMIEEIKRMYATNLEELPNYTPEIQLSDVQKQGFWHNLLVQIKVNKSLLIPLFVLTAFGLWIGSTLLWVSLVLDLLMIAFLTVFTLPKMLFDSLVSATQWAEWDKVFFYAGLLKKATKLINLDMLNHEIDMRVATALAGKGNLDEALKLTQQYEKDPNVPKWLHYARLASVFMVVKDYNKATECQLMAIELGPEGANTLIDYALGLARYHKDTIKAREVLEQISTKEMSELAAIFVSFCKGVILVEEQNYFEANFHLSVAMKKIAPYENLPDLLAEIKAYWAISLAKMGERERATMLFQQAKPMLLANKEAELINRCQQVLN
jgi:tetratricopeptide (TPR) repeat protein